MVLWTGTGVAYWTGTDMASWTGTGSALWTGTKTDTGSIPVRFTFLFKSDGQFTYTVQ